MEKEKEEYIADFQEHFAIVRAAGVRELMKVRDVYALDLRDGSDFLLDDSNLNTLEQLINSGDFIFGVED